MRRSNHVVVLVAFLLFSAPVFAESDQAYSETFPLSPTGTFSLANVNGSVRVEGWERDAVEIRAVKIARGSPTDLYRVNIEVQAAPDSVAVITRYPGGEGVEVSVDYRIKVPYRAALQQVTTVNGEIVVRGMESSGELRTVNGGLKLLDSVGRFTLHATNGNLHVEAGRLARDHALDLETVNGSVFLALAPGADADLDVISKNGDLRSELRITEQSSTARGFRGRLGRGGAAVRIRTVNGGIQLATSRPVV